MPLNVSLILPTASHFKNRLSRPILARLLENRSMSLMIVSAAALHSGLVWLGLPGWECPFRSQLGIPCPGCGLSRAIGALIYGDWQTSLKFHAFAPLFLAALILMTGIILLPPYPRAWAINRIEALERYTGITAILLISLIFYWLIRLLIFPEAFISLIMG